MLNSEFPPHWQSPRQKDMYRGQAQHNGTNWYQLLRKCRNGALLVCAMVIGASMANAKQANVLAKTTAQKISTVEGITEYRLQNGLKILLMPDASKPTVAVNMTYLVGSRHENYGETGMAHLLEHMLFKGTPRNPRIDEQFNQRGMRSNGTTDFDRTNFSKSFKPVMTIYNGRLL